MSLRPFPTLFSFRVSVFGLMLRCLINLDLSSMQGGDKYGFISIILPEANQFTSVICWRCCPFPVCLSGFLIKIQVFISVWTLVYVFSLITMSVFMPVPCSFYCYSFMVQFISPTPAPSVHFSFLSFFSLFTLLFFPLPPLLFLAESLCSHGCLGISCRADWPDS